MRHLAVSTDFVPLKWHDLARHIVENYGNKIRASVRVAIQCTHSRVVGCR